MSKVLLTGASGWLGRFLAPMLIKSGHKVIGLDVAPSKFTNEIGSVGDSELVDDIFKRHSITSIIHAGALHKPDIVRFAPQCFVDTNVQGTLNLLETARSNDVGKFIFTSTTSLMIDKSIRAANHEKAVWLDETHEPIRPRNIYGVTKYAAENLCRQYCEEYGLNVVALRVSRFFPEIDDTIRDIASDNLKANEFLNRRHTVIDCARAHLHVLGHMKPGYSVYLISAPPKFQRQDCAALKKDPIAVIAKHYPDAERLFAQKNWQLPATISRVYDGSKICRELDFKYKTDFSSILTALRNNASMPFIDDPDYINPSTIAAELIRRR